MIFVYIFTLIALTIFSFGFVDANFPVKMFPFIFDVVHNNRPLATGIYTVMMILLFSFYLWVMRQDRIIWKLIIVTSSILFLSFPAFSYDIFNYIATAKISFLYRENPYVVMPINIPNEPMLSFLHAANKVSLYGPTWILLTFIPHFIGFGNLIVTIYTFKAMIVGFYLALCWIIWRLSGKNTRALTFFALNPVVVTESLVSAHNDVVMMFLALWSFYLAKQKRWRLGLLILIFSVFVKGTTVVLLPLYFLKKPRKKVWMWSALLLLAAFFASPMREELYPWYFIWPLTFIALLPEGHWMQFLSHGFSFGLPMRFAPYIYFGHWGGIVPILKKLVSFIPPALSLMYYAAKKKT